MIAHMVLMEPDILAVEICVGRYLVPRTLVWTADKDNVALGAVFVAMVVASSWCYKTVAAPNRLSFAMSPVGMSNDCLHSWRHNQQRHYGVVVGWVE
jgi:hypothetical protein